VLRRHPGRRPDPWVALVEVIEATDAELLERFDRLYLFDREPRWLRRNALIALANVGRPGEADIERVLVASLGHDDPIIRAHAVWAAARLMGPDAVRALADDPDPRVRLEVSAVLP
jgi:epoxyqueuosine reductase QueG